MLHTFHGLIFRLLPASKTIEYQGNRFASMQNPCPNHINRFKFMPRWTDWILGRSSGIQNEFSVLIILCCFRNSALKPSWRILVSYIYLDYTSGLLTFLTWWSLQLPPAITALVLTDQTAQECASGEHQLKALAIHRFTHQFAYMTKQANFCMACFYGASRASVFGCK